ncbi:hypothetical protein [Paucilactobacillus sp. N302-9]
MPPHNVSDLYSLLGSIALFLTFFVWIMNMWIIKPLTKSIDLLSKKVDGIGGNADIVHDRLDKRIDDHDIRLGKHDEEFKTLFSQLKQGDEK